MTATRQQNATGNSHGVVHGVDEALVERMWHELDGQVSRAQIGGVVAAIAAGYEDAPVQTFVPILIHRQALAQLKALLR